MTSEGAEKASLKDATKRYVSLINFNGFGDRFPEDVRSVELDITEWKTVVSRLAKADAGLEGLKAKIQAAYDQSRLLQMPMVDLDETSLEYGKTNGLKAALDIIDAEIKAQERKHG